MKPNMKKFLPHIVLIIVTFSLSGFLMFGTQVPTSEGQFCSQLLGNYSDDYFRFGSDNRELRMALNENRRKGSATIFTSYASELAETIDVDITASGLPPGIRLEDEVVESLGGAGTIKYFFLTGNPTVSGEYEVELRASSPGCEDDEGRVTIIVAEEGDWIRCELTSAGGVRPGESATLTWRIIGAQARNATMFPSIAGNPTALRTSGSGQTNPLTEDTEFTLTVDGPDDYATCNVKVLVGGTSGNTTQFIKTLLDMPTIHNGGGQGIYDGIYWNDRFVFSGHCGVNMMVSAPGGGLWSIKSDGSGNVQERQACLDAGSGSNSIYQHGHVQGAYLYTDGNRGFVRGNQSWASCLSKAGTDPYQSGQDCAQYGPGANRAVYYTAGGEGRVDVLGLSPDDDPNNPLADIRSRWQVPKTVAGGYVFGSHDRNNGWVARLPTWSGVTSISSEISPKIGFGKYIIAPDPAARTSYPPHKVYAVEEGRVREVQTLPGNIRFLGYYAFDHSTTPERLVIYSPNTQGDSSRRLLTYIQTESGLELVSEHEAPASSEDHIYGRPTAAKGGFGVLGEYLIWPVKDGFSVLRNGQVIDEVRFPKGGRATNILVSPTGHVAVSVNGFGESERRTAAYLYKLNGVTGQPPINPPINPPIFPPGFGFGVGQGQGADFNFYMSLAKQLVTGIGFSVRGGEDATAVQQQGFGPTTEEGIKQFQCRYGIVCSGSKETTGWGNMGPQTRAKIQEVYGGTSASSGSFNLYNQTTGSTGASPDYQSQINDFLQGLGIPTSGGGGTAPSDPFSESADTGEVFGASLDLSGVSSALDFLQTKLRSFLR